MQRAQCRDYKILLTISAMLKTFMSILEEDEEETNDVFKKSTVLERVQQSRFLSPLIVMTSLETCQI